MRKVQVSILAVLLATGGVLYPALAQTTNAPVAAKTVKSWHVIKARNVQPGIIAWWIDPQHNPEPFTLSRGGQRIETAPGTLPGAFTSQLPNQKIPPLPAGIESITSSAMRHEILAFGTAAAAIELEKIVAALDKPLRQVEITAQYLAVEPEAAKSLGLNFTADVITPHPDDLKRLQAAVSPLPELSPAVSARPDIQTKLDKLVAEGKAKFFDSLRVTAISGLASNLGITTNTPTRIEFVGPGHYDIGRISSTPPDKDSRPIYVSSTLAIASTPIISENETIILPVQLSNVESLTPYAPLRSNDATQVRSSDFLLPFHFDRRLHLRTHSLAQTVVRVRDGQTIAVAASAWPGAGVPMPPDVEAKFKARPKDDRTYLLLVTPRIVRRIDEK